MEYFLQYRFQESGLLLHWSQSLNYTATAEMLPFFTMNGADTHTLPTAITLDDLSGAFILLALGLFASLVQFGFEMISKCRTYKYLCTRNCKLK